MVMFPTATGKVDLLFLMEQDSNRPVGDLKSEEATLHWGLDQATLD